MKGLRRRPVLGVLGCAIFLAGVHLWSGPPRFTWLNTGLRVDYARRQAAGAFGAAIGAGLLVVPAPRRWLKAASGLLAAAMFMASLHCIAFRLDAEGDAVKARGLLGTTRIPWRDVSRVESGPTVVVVWGNGDDQVRIDTGDFRPEDRATFDRTVARRVREAGRVPEAGGLK